MKLADILARELKVWPEDCEAIEQDRRGSCLFKVNGPAISTYVEAIAEDAETAKVTRAQWQAAVDALNAGEVSYSAESVSVDVSYVAHTNQPVNAECKIVRPEWNGEGLPPVDTEIEWLDGEWLKVLVVGSHKGAVVAVDEKDPRRVFIGKSACYRPIRTPEQIAADEQEKGILQMAHDCGHWWQSETDTKCLPPIFAAIWKAGYRKFEIVDN